MRRQTRERSFDIPFMEFTRSDPQLSQTNRRPLSSNIETRNPPMNRLDPKHRAASFPFPYQPYQANNHSLSNLGLEDIRDIDSNKWKIYNAVFIGDSGTGKTSIIQKIRNNCLHYNIAENEIHRERMLKLEKYLLQNKNPETEAQIQDCRLKLEIPSLDFPDHKIKFQFIDLPGSDHYVRLRDEWLGKADIVFCVYAIDNPVSLENCLNYFNEIIEICPENCMRVLVANKIDFRKRRESVKLYRNQRGIEFIGPQDIEIYAIDGGFQFYEISTYDDDNKVYEMFCDCYYKFNRMEQYAKFDFRELQQAANENWRQRQMIESQQMQEGYYDQPFIGFGTNAREKANGTIRSDPCQTFREESSYTPMYDLIDRSNNENNNPATFMPRQSYPIPQSESVLKTIMKYQTGEDEKPEISSNSQSYSGITKASIQLQQVPSKNTRRFEFTNSRNPDAIQMTNGSINSSSKSSSNGKSSESSQNIGPGYRKVNDNIAPSSSKMSAAMQSSSKSSKNKFFIPKNESQKSATSTQLQPLENYPDQFDNNVQSFHNRAAVIKSNSKNYRNIRQGAYNSLQASRKDKNCSIQ